MNRYVLQLRLVLIVALIPLYRVNSSSIWWVNRPQFKWIQVFSSVPKLLLSMWTIGEQLHHWITTLHIRWLSRRVGRMAYGSMPPMVGSCSNPDSCKVLRLKVICRVKPTIMAISQLCYWPPPSFKWITIRTILPCLDTLSRLWSQSRIQLPSSRAAHSWLKWCKSGAIESLRHHPTTTTLSKLVNPSPQTPIKLSSSSHPRQHPEMIELSPNILRKMSQRHCQGQFRSPLSRKTR